jgi:protein-S-isoprenylcysteine O-methyltransferase Ste14
VSAAFTHEEFMTVKDASLLATSVLVIAVLGLVAQHALLANAPVPMAGQVTAGLLMVWARVTFGLRSWHAAATPTAGGLVTTGPYRLVRHPIYSAILLFLWCGVASHVSPLSMLMAVVASAAIAVRIGTEERLVTVRYPEYAAYAARTRRVIPFVL